MANASRLPSLSKLSIALIESFVKPFIGDKAIEVIKAPYVERELREKLQEILAKVEKKFVAEHKNKDLTAAVLSLPIHDLHSLQTALRAFYDNPTSSDLSELLRSRIQIDFKQFMTVEIDLAVDDYLGILRRELISLSEDIRQKLQTGSIIDIQENIEKLTKSLGATAIEKQPVLGLAPSIPNLVVGRKDDILLLKKRLGILTEGGPLQRFTAIRGWPGVGKTTIASILAHDGDVAAQFLDGILWISLGPKPDLLTAITIWGRSMGEDFLKFSSLSEASTRLSELLRSKKMLLLIDDVWETEHAMPFLVGGKDCATLITTRESEVALALAPTAEDVYWLPVLTEEYSLMLLQKLTPRTVSKYPVECRQLAVQLEGLPLALQVAGHMLHTEESYGFNVIDLLQDLRDTTKILEAKAPADRTDVEKETSLSVAALLLKSTDRLDKFTRDCFSYLGVFAPKPATFDLSIMKKIWDVDDPKPIARTLIDRGLLEPVADTGRFQLHSLLVAHAKSLLTEN